MRNNRKNGLSLEILECLYDQYNQKKFVHPDPLEFLFNYSNLKDREIVGLIASSLAYGNVKQILKSTSIVLDNIGPKPHDFLKKTTSKDLKRIFKNFKHRFTTGDELSKFLSGIARINKKHGSLLNYFKRSYSEKDGNFL